MVVFCVRRMAFPVYAQFQLKDDQAENGCPC